MTRFIFLVALFSINTAIFAGPLPSSSSLLRKEAILYERALGVKQDFEKAYRLYCLAAIEGDQIATYSIGWMYFNGRGMQRNAEKAIGWFQRAAELGSSHGGRILKRFPNIPPKPDESCPIYTPSMAVSKKHVDAWVRIVSPEFSIDPELVLHVIATESAFDRFARSPKNARGLMQLIPATAKRFGVTDVWNPVQNIIGGVTYLKWLMGYFDGNLPLVLAAYNAGEGVVKRYRGIPPFAETRNYVRRIIANYEKSLQS